MLISVGQLNIHLFRQILFDPPEKYVSNGLENEKNAISYDCASSDFTCFRKMWFSLTFHTITTTK